MPSTEIDLHGHHWVNAIGHSAGILVFATLFVLIYRDSRRAGHSLRILPLVSTLLALGWDLGLLIGIATLNENAFWANAAAALAFVCLSLMPAVLLDLGLGPRLKALKAAGYTLGGFCALLHASEVFVHGPDIHGFALIALSLGFALLAAISYWRLRQQNINVSAAGSLCLFLLSISILHFREEAGSHALWTEIILHHAGIPVALFVVMQDYRFILLDAFTRLAANGVLAGIVVAILWESREPMLRLANSSDPFGFGMLMVGCGLTLLGFAKAREAVQRWLTARVFQRHNPESVTQSLQRLEGDETVILDTAARTLASYFRAERWQIAPSQLAWADAATRIQFLKGDYVYLNLAGRRFLSEDLDALEDFCLIVAREVDRARTRELERLMVQAELRALQAQIHPHFLFNALNALYGSIPRQAADARRLVLSLSEVFRYFLTTSRSTVRLEEELTIIQAYLEIEKARLGPRLSTSIDIPAEWLSFPIPVLSVEPLVENAIKHGIAAQSGPGEVSLTAFAAEGVMTIIVRDTGPGPADATSTEGNRVGLDNVRRRLHLHYGDAATLEVSHTGGFTAATLRIPVDGAKPPAHPAAAATGGILLGDS